MLTAVFRADASQEIGGGHIMRCLTLATELRKEGWRCIFAINHEAIGTVSTLLDSGCEWLEFSAVSKHEDANKLGDRLNNKADILIVDHYGLDYEFENAAYAWAHRILAIDDLPNRKHKCDFLLDQTCGRSRDDYFGLVPDNCHLLLGSDYALLRSEFSKLRTQAINRTHQRIERVFISFGVSDAQGLCAVATKAACAAGAKHIDIAVGSVCPHLAALQAMAESTSVIQLHIDAEPAALMAVADIAIGAAGTTSWERCCLGLPTLLIVIAENQEQIAQRLAASGAAINLGRLTEATYGQIVKCLNDFASHPLRLQSMSAAAIGICDGMGARRVLRALSA